MNGKTQNLITFRVQGTESEHGHVRIDEFLDQLEHLLSSLNGIDRIVSHTGQPTLYYRVIRADHQSPLAITLEPVIRKRINRPDPDHVEKCHHRFFLELSAISRREPVSPEVDESLLEHLLALAEGVGTAYAHASVSNGEFNIELDHAFENNVKRLMDEETASYGGFEGKLDAVNIHGQIKRFWIYPRIGPQRVRCDFLHGTWDQVKEVIGHYIRVEGVKHFRPQSCYPFRISVKEFEVLDDDQPVYLQDLKGIAPQATGQMTSVEFVRALRDEWEQ